jgi:hypothetical protein
LTYRLGAIVLAASNALLAFLVDQVLGVDGNQVQDGDYPPVRYCYSYLGAFTKFLTVEVQVIAAVEKTKAIATGATTESIGEKTVQNAVVLNRGVASGDLLVAAGDDSVIATLGVGLLKGEVLRDGLNVLAGRAVAGGEGQSSGSEEESGGEELHFDGLINKHEK